MKGGWGVNGGGMMNKNIFLLGVVFICNRGRLDDYYKGAHLRATVVAI